MKVQASSQLDWIATDKPPRRRVVIPIPVVVQPRLVVKVLLLETDRIPEARLAARLADRLLRFIPGLVAGRSSDAPFMVR